MSQEEEIGRAIGLAAGEQIKRIVSVHLSALEKAAGVDNRMYSELAESVLQTRFGNSKTIEPRLPGDLDCYAAVMPAGIKRVSRPRLLFLTDILRVRASDLQKLAYLPGSWMLTIDARPTSDLAASDYPGDFLLSPLVARVTLGTGAAAHVVEVDALGSVLAIPAMDVQVDIGISQVLGLDEPNGSTFGLFASYEVRAVLHKVGGVAIAQATRTVICNGSDFILPIPAFGSCWCFVPSAPLAFGDLIAAAPTELYYQEQDTPYTPPYFPAESVPVDIVSSMARTHCFRPYHPLARTIGFSLLTVDVPPEPYPEATYPGALVSRISF